MHSSKRPAWMPLAVFVLCVFGTLALAQPPGFPRQPPAGFGPMGPPGTQQPPGVQPPGYGPGTRQPPAGFGPMAPGSPANSGIPGGPPAGFGPMGGDNTVPMGPPNAGMPRMGMPNAGMPQMPEVVMQSQGTCSKCNKTVTWTGATAPTSCPHCGTKFGYVENADGSRTTTTYGRSSSIRLYIFLGIVAISVIAAIIKGIMAAASGGGSRKKKLKKKKPMRRPRDDDDY
ncbi:MAG: hypothetical protein KF873_18050 [Gemmataceae bacterium]|nr:hypothetical protein [Gemmataceae bacterium]